MKIDDRALKAAMRKMGMQSVDIDATEVIIRTKDKEIIVHSPNVVKVNMMGQDTFQIMGRVSERPILSITEDDVETVSTQAQVDKETARQALARSNGDIAQAIISLQNE